MENYEYSKTYPLEAEEDIASDLIEAVEMADYIHKCERDAIERPKLLLPFAPALFEEAVAKCELIVKEFSGKIEAKIDYSTYEATIELWCLYVDFNRGEFLETLHDLTRVAISIQFQPLTTGDLYIKVYMPYFVPIKSKNSET